MGRVVYRHDRGRDSRETDLSYRIIWYRIVPVRYCTYLPGVKCVCNFFLPFLFFSLFSSFSFLFSLLALLNKKSFFISYPIFSIFSSDCCDDDIHYPFKWNLQKAPRSHERCTWSIRWPKQRKDNEERKGKEGKERKGYIS